MALRLKKDVQKASYYVWFLGAQEARGLRGSRVLLSAIPPLIERAREQEPLKVTLQVSHKGIKIIQGASKHFIAHSAITSSIQTDDIVACVLLLYNPTTKCPLHVHAYRCDTESTAIALNQQLQILINRPENQKRLTELESRLGLNNPGKSVPLTEHSPLELETKPRRIDSPSRRFDSSLGSDTGTSTRESECSEEQVMSNSPASPTAPIGGGKASIFDSLAAELRAKLNGNGPPLLLPPRDYDTVHRSKGNLAAIELRRCQNAMIVGNTGPGSGSGGGGVKQTGVISSRGSSGIGSDLAPSPERQDTHSSTDDDWALEPEEPTFNERKQSPPRRLSDERQRFKEKLMKRFEAGPLPPVHTSRIDQAKQNNEIISRSKPPLKRIEVAKMPINDTPIPSKPVEEEQIKPKIHRPRPFDTKFREVLEDVQFLNGQQNNNHSYEDDMHHNGPRGSKAIPFRKTNYGEPEHDEIDNQRFNTNERYEKTVRRTSSNKDKSLPRSQNLTDHEKKWDVDERYYKKESSSPMIERPRQYRDQRPAGNDRRSNSIEITDNYVASRQRSAAKSPAVPEKFAFGDSIRNFKKLEARTEAYREQRMEYNGSSEGYGPSDGYRGERRYDREPVSMPFQHSKPPLVKYNSYGDRSPYVEEPSYPVDGGHYKKNSRFRELDRDHTYIDDLPHMPSHMKVSRNSDRSSDRHSTDTAIKVSPRERFDNARDKFQSMERTFDESFHHHKVEPHAPYPYFPPPPPRDNWTEEDEFRMRQFHREPPPVIDRYPGLAEHHPGPRMQPSKSLGNLVKGYRHSYVEPDMPVPRNSGRVGLAAVNPY